MIDGQEDPQVTARYRLHAAVIMVVVGLIATVLLGTTLLNTSPTQLSAPHELVGLDAFAGKNQDKGGPFYAPQQLTPDQQVPGTVLKSEPIPGAPPGITALRFTYVSQSADEKFIVVSGMYATRTNSQPDGRPLVAVAHGTTGMSPGCGISQAPFTPQSTGFATWDQIMSGLVGAGFAVVATDYANLGVPATPNYLVQKGEAYDVLNAIRAAYKLDPAGLNTGQTAILGHSQGGHAALSAGAELPGYAPEISIKGVVAIAPAIFPPAPVLVDFIQSAPDTDARYFLGFVSYVVEAWSANFPDQIKPSDVFTPAGVQAATAGSVTCLAQTAAQFAGPKKNFVSTAIPLSIVNLAVQNFPLYDQYAMPLLMQQGLEDTTVVPGVNIAAAKTFCQQGSTVDLQTYPNDVHSSVLYTGQSQAIEWLNGRFAGEPAPSNCGGL